MTIAIAGLNHDSGGMEVLARVTLPKNKLIAGLRSLRLAIPKSAEALILTTCNRCELYVKDIAVDEAILWFSEYQGIAPEMFTKYAYLHTEEEALRHLIKVACGINSMLIGETQILGQVKRALQNARETGCSGKGLSRLFEHAIKAAKRVRCETEIGKHSLSFPALIVKFSRHIFADLSQQQALFIGSGEMTLTTMKYFRERGIGNCCLAGRCYEKTAKTAVKLGINALSVAELPAQLHNFDIVVSSTASKENIIHLDTVKKAMGKRRRRVMFMVDLAVPGDIDKRIDELEDVFLYDLERLTNASGQSREERKLAEREARTIIDQEVKKYFAWKKASELGQIISAYEVGAARKRDQIETAALAMLRQGKNPEKVVSRLCATLSGTLSHQAITVLKELANSYSQSEEK